MDGIFFTYLLIKILLDVLEYKLFYIMMEWKCYSIFVIKIIHNKFNKLTKRHSQTR